MSVGQLDTPPQKKLTRGMLKSPDTSVIAFEIVLQTGPIIANAFGLVIISLNSMFLRAYCIINRRDMCMQKQ